MEWLAACSGGVSRRFVFKDGTIDHDRYIQEVPPVALKYRNKAFEDNWIFQHDGVKAHTHAKKL